MLLFATAAPTATKLNVNMNKSTTCTNTNVFASLIFTYFANSRCRNTGSATKNTNMNNAQTNVIKWIHQYWGSKYRLQPSIKPSI